MLGSRVARACRQTFIFLTQIQMLILKNQRIPVAELNLQMHGYRINRAGTPGGYRPSTDLLMDVNTSIILSLWNVNPFLMTPESPDSVILFQL
jgi:hypothetical protein